MAVGFSDGTAYKDEQEWLVSSHAAVNQEVSQMKEQGNIDLTQRPQVRNEDGSISTVRSMSIGTDQGEVLIPTVAHGGSRVLSEPEAIQQWRDSGKHLGIFQTPEEATKYADFLHKSQADLYPTIDSKAGNSPADALKPTGGGGSTGETSRTNFFSRLSMVNAFKGMASPSFEEDKKILSGVWEGIKKGLSLTEAPAWALDQTTGEYHTSPQAVERAADLAGLMVTGPAPVAAKMADGTLGSFMGVKSATIDKTKLYKAQQMEMDMAHADDIWRETGTFRGADNRWRQEIPDKDATLNPNAFDVTEIPAKGGSGQWDVGGHEASVTWSPKSRQLDIDKIDKMTLREAQDYIEKQNKEISLPEVLNHPELFKAYPQLKNVQVKELPAEFVARNIKGMMSGDDLYLAPNLHPDYIRSVMLHEIQHKIQDIEGFARGGSPRQFRTKELEAAETNFNKVRAEAESEIAERMGEKGKSAIGMWKSVIRQEQSGAVIKEAQQHLDTLKKDYPDIYEKLSNIVRSEDLLHKANLEHFEKYQRLMGEVEARNVQKRMNYDEWDRKSMSPINSQDRPTFIQTEQ